MFKYRLLQVLNHMKHSCPCCRRYLRRQRDATGPTSFTQVTTYEANERVAEVLPPKNDITPSQEKNVMEMDDFSTKNGQIIRPNSPEKTGGYIPLQNQNDHTY